MNYGMVLAAGKSDGFSGNADRAFLSLGPKPILAYSLLAFENCADIDGVILVVRKERVESARSLIKIFGCSKVIKIIAGTALRQNSVNAALKVMPEDARIITVHEAARPNVTPELISATIAAAKRGGAAAAGLKIIDAVVSSERWLNIGESVNASKLWAIQSPQSFKLDILREAIDKSDAKKSIIDEASAVTAAGTKVRIVPGSRSNVKIQTPDDVPFVATLMKL